MPGSRPEAPKAAQRPEIERLAPAPFASAVDIPDGMSCRLESNEAEKAAGRRWVEYLPGRGCVYHGPLSPEQQAERAEDNARRLRGRLLAAGLPGNFVDANFAANSRGEALQITEPGGEYLYGTRKAHTACRSLSEKWEPGYVSARGYSGVILQSPTFGLGKTYLVSAILVALARCGQRVGFVKCEDLLSRYRASFGGQRGTGAGQSAEQIFEEYARVPILALDELGGDYIKSGEAGEWARSQFLRLMDRRLDGGLTTLGTTNATKDDLVAHYGGRMASRLLATSTLIPMDGPDFRQTDAAGVRLSDEDDPFAG